MSKKTFGILLKTVEKKRKGRYITMTGYFGKRLQNEKIEKRFSMMFVAVITIFITVILLISDIVLYRSEINKTEKEIQTNCEMIAMQIEKTSDNAKTCLKIITKDINRIYSGDTVFGTDAVGAVTTVNEIYTALDYSRNCFNDISGLIYAGNDGTVVVAGKAKEVATPGKDELENLISKIPEKGLADAKDLGIGKFSFVSKGTPAWVLGHRIIDMNTGKNLGYVFAVILTENLSSHFPETDKEGFTGEYQLLNQTGEIIASQDTGDLLEKAGNEQMVEKIQEGKSFRIRENGKSYLITNCAIRSHNWYLINRVGISELTNSIRILLGVIIVAGIFCILLSVSIIRKIVKWITRPIQELTETARQFRKENLKVRCSVATSDEIGELAGVFNEMLQRIEYQMENIRLVQKEKRKYELALIQAQIKPHFLYNTLDLIYIFCQMKNTEGAAKVTKAMADYYRTSLSSGREIITIAEEVKNISSYLLIQKERYSNKIDFKIEVDPSIYNCAIPKMTLQPLVENAIYHGLKSRKEKGNIYVKGWNEDEMICLLIQDDGVGMSKEKLQQILQNEEDINKGHFGVSSVHRRIQLYYGTEYGVNIESTEFVGTRVLIKIPRKEEI